MNSTTKGPDTHLNGARDNPGLFITAFVDDYGDFYGTGGVYITQREADNAANALAAREAQEVFVFKAVSKHTSRIVVSTEAV